MANLFGDFVKGKNFSHLPEIVQQGVRLHRSIDSYIDHHPAITELRQQLYTPLPKIAGIAIDIYMDHLLARNWRNFHLVPLENYVKDFFQFALNTTNQSFSEPIAFTYPPEIIDLLTKIHQGNWIVNYQTHRGLTFACTGLSRRISFPNVLAQAPQVYLIHERQITTVFHEFMRDAKVEFGIE